MYNLNNFRYMEATVEKLRESCDLLQDKDLRRPYDSKVGAYPCRSFNFGDQSVSLPHVDHSNLAQGWCSITPLGSFDPKRGGHLVLWDVGLMVEFPPGSTALIPSALFKHSNTTLQTGETRLCITQYAAGGLFRWVNNDFMTERAWHKKASKEQLRVRHAKQDSRWLEAAGMFTRLSELRYPKKSQEVPVLEADAAAPVQHSEPVVT
jgi:hypothetical protein